MSRLDLHVHVHHAADPDTAAALSRIEAHMSELMDEMTVVKTKLADLKNTTAANNRSLLQALNAIIADLRNNPGDTAAALAAAKALEAQADDLKATLEGDDTANTPAS